MNGGSEIASPPSEFAIKNAKSSARPCVQQTGNIVSFVTATYNDKFPPCFRQASRSISNISASQPHQTLVDRKRCHEAMGSFHCRDRDGRDRQRSGDKIRSIRNVFCWFPLDIMKLSNVPTGGSLPLSIHGSDQERMLLADPNPWMPMALNLDETLFGFHGCGNRHPSAAMSENKIACSDSLDWTIPGRGQNHCSPRKTIGTEPGEPDRSSFRRLDGIDIPDVLAMMDRFWVIRFVNTKSDLIMVHGDIHFESRHLDTGAGTSASREIVGNQFFFKHWLSPIIHSQISDTYIFHF
ncbi:hypothetical protein LptCag_1528 [Leptospirillum ferriphilum]|uniref:Uncharacterized protein n=1 Tax=Leptospirillum ferriphilum TaxID=178606 RepID=A0A094W8F6_9BACT|nr:hypothetical protein LptCag_1528 [Leptospirillum ferriphilum]